MTNITLKQNRKIISKDIVRGFIVIVLSGVVDISDELYLEIDWVAETTIPRS